jgi:hypothetical protein
VVFNVEKSDVFNCCTHLRTDAGQVSMRTTFKRRNVNHGDAAHGYLLGRGVG